MLYREALEARERRNLAPFAVFSADTKGRHHTEQDDPHRTAYQRDRDRIVHSTAFRRLEYKTQVFVYHEGDHFRTRLTHSLEVAQIARSVGNALGLNESFIEALALAHDLGHPPFGHAGGEVLHAKMKDHGGFEHNVQGLRIVDRLEQRYPDFAGLNLSYEVREAILKHGAAVKTPETAEFEPVRPPLLETVLVDLADSTAYNHHDVDDGLRADILDLDKLCAAVPLVERSRKKALEAGRALSDRELRMALINCLVKECIADLIRTSDERLQAAKVDSASAARQRGDLIGFSPALAEELEALQGHLFTRFYRHYRVVRMMDKAKRILAELFDAYTDRPELLPPEFQKHAEQEGIHRAVCDYLAGMTDRYAEQDWRKLFDPTERV